MLRTCSGTCHRFLMIWMCGFRQPSSFPLPLGTQRALTPRTIPSGKRMPQASIWTKMCIHSVVSCQTRQNQRAVPHLAQRTMGSGEIVCPSGIMFSACPPCVDAIGTNATARATLAVVREIRSWRRGRVEARSRRPSKGSVMARFRAPDRRFRRRA